MDFSHLAFEFQWEQCFTLINQWKTTMIDHINHIHQEKTSQIQLYKDQAEKCFFGEKTNLILNLNEYFQHSCILSDEINSFKRKLNQLKENIIHRPLPLNIQIKSSSLENTISISPLFNPNLFHQKKILADYSIPTESIRLITTSQNQIILVNQQSKIFFYEKFFGLINEIDLRDYTQESLNDICWSTNTQKYLLLLCEHSLWTIDNFLGTKLAHIPTAKHVLNHLTCFHNYLFLIYNQGEFIDRWRLEPEWKLDKRWMKYQKTDRFFSIHSNEDYLLFYTKQFIQLCSADLIIQYSIDLSTQEHLYSHWIYFSSYQIWLMIDQLNDRLNYFHLNDRIIHPLEEISLQAICSIGDNLVLITKETNHLQIISI